MINLTAHQLRQAADLQEKIASLNKQLNGLLGSNSGSSQAKPQGKKTMSAAARAKIAAAVKARWAKVKGSKSTPAKASLPAKRRTMSPAAKAKLAALAKARWAKVKAAGKKTL